MDLALKKLYWMHTLARSVLRHDQPFIFVPWHDQVFDMISRYCQHFNTVSTFDRLEDKYMATSLEPACGMISVTFVKFCVIKCEIIDDEMGKLKSTSKHIIMRNPPNHTVSLLIISELHIKRKIYLYHEMIQIIVIVIVTFIAHTSFSYVVY
uniref:Uncharacterized protein n=1 Tax=Glossina brevipalpis TaxID=37001 RepID=A0A1A9W2H3_9MUSC